MIMEFSAESGKNVINSDVVKIWTGILLLSLLPAALAKTKCT
jgi:hypothetical protein